MLTIFKRIGSHRRITHVTNLSQMIIVMTIQYLTFTTISKRIKRLWKKIIETKTMEVECFFTWSSPDMAASFIYSAGALIVLTCAGVLPMSSSSYTMKQGYHGYITRLSWLSQGYHGNHKVVP